MTDLVLEQFWEHMKVDPISGCWNWQANRNHKGYGQYKIDGKTVKAHRFAFEVNRGKIPDGLQLDHLCRNRACVNPEHMEIVTSRENTMRGFGFTSLLAKRTHCKNGHEFTPENTRMRKSARVCRICQRNYRNKSRKKLLQILVIASFVACIVLLGAMTGGNSAFGESEKSDCLFSPFRSLIL